MANLVLRNLDDRIVQALKRRAARHARSADAEHRAILGEALPKTRRRSLVEVLTAMRNVGRDEDFRRVDSRKEADVFG